MTKEDATKPEFLQKEATPSAPPPRIKSADPGSAQGSDEIHLRHSARWKQHRPPYYKQMELERNRNLRTICMMRCSLSIMALSRATVPVCLQVARAISSGGQVSLLGVLMKDLFLLTSVLLPSHYLSTAASPTINDTKSNKTNMKNMDHVVIMERDNSKSNVSHLDLQWVCGEKKEMSNI